ncbi:hypothetical protein ACFQHO_11395 [Actinomadura yumaensis]
MGGYGDQNAAASASTRTTSSERARGGALLALAGLLVLSGCGTGDDDSSDASSPGGSSSAKPPAKSSAPPKPADGTDLAACADGRCEVQVSASAKLPVPRKLKVASVRVESVGSGSVTVVGRYLGNSQGGFCTGRSCNSSGSGGGFKLTLGPDSTGSQNGLSITALTVSGGTAVLRLAPVD